MTLTTKKKLKIIEKLLLISIALSLSVFAINSMFQTEQEILNDAFSSLNLQHPTYNETTRFFETQQNNNIYIGYIEFNTTETSTIKVLELVNYTNTIIEGNMILYASVDHILNSKDDIIYQKNINRRFN